MRSFRQLLLFQIAVLFGGVFLFIVLLGLSTFKLASDYEKEHVEQVSSVLAENIKLISELYPNRYLIEETMKKAVNEIPALDGMCLLMGEKRYCYPQSLSERFLCGEKEGIVHIDGRVAVCLPVYEEYATQLLEKKREGYFLAVFNAKYIDQFRNFWFLMGTLVSAFFLVITFLVISSLWIDINVDFNRLRVFIDSLKKPGVLFKNRDFRPDFKIKELKEVADLILNLTEQISNLNDRIKKLAITDPLTGLFNRNYIDWVIRTSYIPFWKRKGFPLTVAILDIDNFKSINDIFGHMKGDEILRKFGQIVKDTVRSSDIPIRFGGEEILVIFPSSTKEEAVRAVKRIRERLLEEDFGIGRPITFSSGLSDFPSDTESPGDLEKLIEIADQRLYRAKRLGKNRDVLD